jgi:bla regulator protein blaR1
MSHLRHAVIVLLLTPVSVALLAQDGPTFEVATIKRNVSLSGEGGMRVESGRRFVAVNVPVLWLIAMAYSESMGALRPEQIVGAPAWVLSERYDIAATASAQSDTSSFPKTRLLLRSLLEDRLTLRTHRDQRSMAMYALVRAGALGPRFRQSTPDCLQEAAKCGFAGGPAGRIKADAISMDLLTQLLANATNRIVVDRTNLKVGFEIDLEWSPDQTSTDKPSIFAAVKEQLGLKLDATRAPVEVVVAGEILPSTRNCANFRRCAWLLNGMRSRQQ